MTEALDVAEFFAAFFEKDDRAHEAEPTLEQADLMNHVHSRTLRITFGYADWWKLHASA